MTWRWLRRLLCRLGVDGACYRDGAELEERAARMRTLVWRLESLARESRGEQQGRKDGAR